MGVRTVLCKRTKRTHDILEFLLQVVMLKQEFREYQKSKMQLGEYLPHRK